MYRHKTPEFDRGLGGRHSIKQVQIPENFEQTVFKRILASNDNIDIHTMDKSSA